jgi:hypothetical protein
MEDNVIGILNPASVISSCGTRVSKKQNLLRLCFLLPLLMYWVCDTQNTLPMKKIELISKSI